MAFLLGPQQVGQKVAIERKENANQNGSRCHIVVWG